MKIFLLCQALGMVMGFLLDLIFGDPDFKLHPIRLIGNLIGGLDKNLNKQFNKQSNKQGNERTKLLLGIMLAFIVLAVVLFVVVLLRLVAFLIHPLAFVGVEAVLDWFALAKTSLRRETMKVYSALLEGGVDKGIDTEFDTGLEKARFAISMIVGRDTERLDKNGIIRAAVETVAENTSDGIIAPLLYMGLFGAFGAYGYKAINTMDSMVGYKNEKYMYFGRFAAKLDDVANFIPARLSALFMVVAAFLLRLDYKNAWKIFKRDRFNHASPNSAQTESVCAGALGVRLAGDAWYGGVLFKKKYIGDDLRPVNMEDIKVACRLMDVTCDLFLLGILMAELPVLFILWM